jgi:hypothetical protein
MMLYGSVVAEGLLEYLLEAEQPAACSWRRQVFGGVRVYKSSTAHLVLPQPEAGQFVFCCSVVWAAVCLSDGLTLGIGQGLRCILLKADQPAALSDGDICVKWCV